MTTAFLSQGIWPKLTKAVHASREHCAVAVAYFGTAASRLLPLSRGSRLVVEVIRDSSFAQALLNTWNVAS